MQRARRAWSTALLGALVALGATCGGPTPGPELSASLGVDEVGPVEAGLALGHLPLGPERPEVLGEALSAAARAAQVDGRGLFAPDLAPPPRPLEPPLAGIALPMHHKDPTVDYAWELAELSELGAEWVNLVVATRQRRVDSVEVPL